MENPENKSHIILPPMLFAPVGYYQEIAHAQEAVIDLTALFDKRKKTTHRYTISDTRGKLDLTVPIVRPHGKLPWENVKVSDHGEWWKLHLTALESSYGRTPYFEFIIDRFKSIFRDPAGNETVGEMIKKADAEIRSFLLIDTPVYYDTQGKDHFKYTFPEENTTSYWQIRADRLGFISGLSILDLIFNIGPEAALFIRK